MAGRGGNGGGPGGFGGGPAGIGGDFGLDGTDAGDNSGGGGGGANGGHGGAGGTGQGGGAGGDGGLNGSVTTPGSNAATVHAGDGQSGGGSQLAGGGGGAGGYGLVVGAAEMSGSSFTNSGDVTAGNGGNGGTSTFSEGGDGGEGGFGIYLTVAGAQLDNSANIRGGDGGSGGDDVSFPPLASRTGHGGDAGSGVVFAGSGTLINQVGASITGGNGGRGGLIQLTSTDHHGEPAGTTGAGVTGAGLTIVNLGTIRGGIVNSGRIDAFQFDSITFTAGANTVALGSSASFHGAVDLVGNATTLTFDQSAGNGLPDDATFNTNIVGSGSIIKVGNGALTLSAGGSTFTGTTDVQAGTLLVDGSVTNSVITVESGATLGGHGTVGSVTVENGGHFAAGNSPGVMHTGNLSFTAGASFDEEIGGTAVGSGYDQTIVAGTVALNGATLNLLQYAGFVTATGQVYTIIDNDSNDAVSGTFAGLTEGATTVLAGQTLKISYVGGDGNDVVLTDVTPSHEAPSLVVTTLNDVVDANDGLTSLREAITYANSHANADVNTPDVITFASGLTGTIRLTGGTLVVTDALTIDGDLGSNGKPKIVISGDANGDDTHIAGSAVITDIAASRAAGALADNVQLIRTSANLTLDSLVLTGGTAAGLNFEDARGGAVGAFNTANPGTAVSVTATATTSAGNSAASAGGAISASGTVTLDSSTVSGNVSGSALSSAGGGGVFASTVDLTNTTLSGNEAAGRGGGAFGTTVSVLNSTVSGNHSTDEGGGLAASVNVNATNSIIAGNDADSGNDNSTTPLLLHGLNVYGAWLYNDSGFVANTSISAVFASVTANPYTGIASGTLADNGGPVATIALKADPTNPALDSANNSAPSDDARDLARHDYSGIANSYGTAGADLGAFELQDNIAAIAKNDGINILGVTVAYNPVVSATTQAVIANPGSEFQDGDLISDLSGTQLVLSSANDFSNTHDYTYTLLGSDFVFVTVSIVDGGEYGASASVVNGALVVHNPDIYGGEDVTLGFTVGLKEAGTFSGNLFADNGSGADNDPDGDAFSITKINGTVVTDGQVITLPSGALLTIHTDGTFSYDTNHAFDSLNTGGTATESFTYTLTGGGTATMAFTVLGEGAAPDTTPPTITIDTIAGNDVVNAAEGAAAITVSGTAAGAEDGQVVTLALKTAGGSPLPVTATAIVSGGTWQVDLPPGATPAFPDGDYIVTADVSDQAGNPATQAAHTITVDTHAPAITIAAIAGNDVVNATEGAGTIRVSGTAAGAEDGQLVTLALKTANGSITLQTMTAVVVAGLWHLDLPPGATPAFPDGSYLVAADVSDQAGNPATEATHAMTVDTHAPLITINTIAGDDVVTAAEGDGIITVSGTASGAEDRQTVTLALKTADGSATLQTMTTAVSGGTWHLDLPPGATPAFPDGPYLITADVSDAAGNPATEALRGITVDAAPPTPSLFQHIGTGYPGPHGGVYATPGVSDGFTVAATGDFNGDGTSEVLWSDASGRVDEWSMQNESWATSTYLGGRGTDWQIVGTGDFNGDGTDDVLWRNPSTGHLDTWIMQNGQWSKSVDLGARGLDWKVLGVGDFNGDGTDDILFQNATTGTVDGWQMGEGNWSKSLAIGGARDLAYSSVRIGDFDGDGTSDVLWRNPTTGAVDEWHIENGNWAGSIDLGSFNTGYELSVKDFDGDGTADVLWHNPTTGQVEGWVMDHGQWFASVSLGSFDPAYHLGGTGDFNRAGGADVLWHNTTTGQTAVWLLGPA